MAAQISLPIFPLPDLTFFPHTMLPLHIFEARYRAMITDCLSRDKRLAVVGLKPGYEASYEGKPPVHAVCGVGRIVQWERLASGRFNLLLRGEGRVRIDRELPTDTLYRMVAATPLAETAADAAAARGAGRTGQGALPADPHRARALERGSPQHDGRSRPAGRALRPGRRGAGSLPRRRARRSWKSSTSSGGSSASPGRWTPS